MVSGSEVARRGNGKGSGRECGPVVVLGFGGASGSHKKVRVRETCEIMVRERLGVGSVWD